MYLVVCLKIGLRVSFEDEEEAARFCAALNDLGYPSSVFV